MSDRVQYFNLFKGLKDALVEGCGYQNAELCNSMRYADLCKYYRGELETPTKWQNDVKGKFWHGEMMYCRQKHDIDAWAKRGQEILKDLNSNMHELAGRLSPEQFGLVLYIATLFGKWCPYDNLDWIVEY